MNWNRRKNISGNSGGFRLRVSHRGPSGITMTVTEAIQIEPMPMTRSQLNSAVVIAFWEMNYGDSSLDPSFAATVSIS